MKKLYSLLFAMIAVIVIALTIKTAAKPIKSVSISSEGYYFVYGNELQRPEGCCSLAISNIVNVSCPNAPGIEVKSDMSLKFSAFYKANYARSYSYLNNPVVAGPYTTADAANYEKDKIVSNYKNMRSVILYINDFGYNCK